MLTVNGNAKVEPPTHVPLIAKHPEVKLNPTFDVEVAEPEMVRPASVVVPKPVVDTENTEVVAALRMLNAVAEFDVV